MSARNAVDSLWIWALAGGVVALLAGLVFLEKMEVLGIAVGAAAGLVNIFMLKRMAAKAVAQNSPGKTLIFIIFIKSSFRLLLTALFLAILFYLGWLKPLGFVIGFTAVILAIFAWGCSRILFNSHSPL